MIRALLVLSCSVSFLSASRAHARCDDETLQDAAASLLLDGELDAQAISRALHEAGSDAPYAMLRRGSLTEIRAWLAELELDAPLACGWAAADGELLALATARGGSLRPEGDGYRVALADGFAEPYAVLQSEDGRLMRVGVEQDRVIVPEEIRPLARVQLVAHGPAGPRPVAVRVLVEESPVEISGEGGPRTHLAALRAAHDVSPLRDNALLEREATRHAESVCRRRSARHVLDAGDPEERLRRRGIVARVVGEAVARAPSESTAFSAIAASPSHRMALVDRRFTDVGIGVARSRDQRCVVVTLAAWPRAVGGVRGTSSH